MLIVLSGRTASGKSTLAKALAQALNGTAGSFGGYVRHLVEQSGGDAADRKTLQDLGQELVEGDPSDFTARFLKFSGYNPTTSALVVDGLRHLSILKSLKEMIQTPDTFFLIYVDITDTDRYARLKGRGHTNAEIDKIEKHPSEIDVLQGLAEAADLRVEGNLPTSDQVNTVVSTLGL
jgi:dephospho-CoA kinase